MKVVLHNVCNPILKKYINYFYFYERTSIDKEIKYFGFPTPNVFITVFKGADYEITNENIEIVESKSSEVKHVLFFDDEKPGYLKYNGALSEITICFKPLGINHFLEQSFSDYINGAITPIVFFSDFKDQMATVFELTSQEDKALALENYLLSKVKSFDHPFLNEVVSDIMSKTEIQYTVTSIAKKYNISRPTLNKSFKKHLGIKPNQFIKIVRFRNAIENYKTKTRDENLVDVAYLTAYFDQSHMIKDFISLTGYSPKTFFSKISHLENGQINWLFS